MVKVWRVFPYAEESLSLLCTFRSYHPAVALCILGRTIAVGFENLDSATFGLVHFSLDHGPRQDHPPQDDPTDHITGKGAGQRPWPKAPPVALVLGP